MRLHAARTLVTVIKEPCVAVQLAAAYSDPRHSLHITDGIRWVQEAPEASYDAIIVDSSDPVGPAAVLFERVSSRIAA